jgi:hypothetical protein
LSAEVLAAHLAIDGEDRDAKWRHRFYDLIDTTPLAERDPRMIVGPDGFPYFALDLPRGDAPGTVTVAALVEIATNRGFGIAIAPDDEGAAWVFTYGDLLTRRVFETYELPRIGLPALGGFLLREAMHDPSDVEFGAPDETLLPPFVQPLLRRYFAHTLGVRNPGVLALWTPGREPPEQLVFRFSRADVATDGDFENALAGLAWFLPRHVVLSVLESEALDELEAAFVPLLG